MNDKWTEIIKCTPSRLSTAKLDEYLQIAWTHTSGKLKYGDIYAGLLMEKTSRQNRVTIRFSISLSIIALFVAMCALFFSVLDCHSDKAWQISQINELRNQSKYLMKIAEGAKQSPGGDSQSPRIRSDVIRREKSN